MEKVEAICNFISRSIKLKTPANTFIVLDVKVNPNTGSFGDALVGELLQAVCGPDLTNRMMCANETAQNGEHNPDHVWYDDSPFSRGGWRGLLLAIDGWILCYRPSFDSLVSLIDR